MTIISYKKDWAKKVAEDLQNCIESKLMVNSECNVILTGGVTATNVYSAWSSLGCIHKLKNVNYYFGDERLVSSQSLNSNYSMVMRTLFNSRIPEKCSIHRMHYGSDDCENSALAYENLLPNKIDLLLLTIGDDGHIASLFPDSDSLQERTRKVLVVSSPFHKYKRLTITPTVIKNADKIFVLAPGLIKFGNIMRVINSSSPMSALPIGLLLPKAVFLTDLDATNAR